MNESYILKAISASDEKTEQILFEGVAFYAKRINKLAIEMFKKADIDAPLVLAALQSNTKILRTILPEHGLKLADYLMEGIDVAAIDVAELKKQAYEEKGKNEGG